MSNGVRNALALIAGLVIGSVVNLAVIAISPLLIPLPAGVDVSTPEGLSQAMPLLEPRHFVMPFLAHALGTLVGALVAYLIAATYKIPLAFVVGVFFLAGGIAASFMIPAPAWFIGLDLLAAYLPMAWLGASLGARMQQQSRGA